MGKSGLGDGDNSKKRQARDQPEKGFINRPFKTMGQGGMARPAGPECLACNGPIDSRPGMSLAFPRGTRKVQRNGYLHPDCELAAEVALAQKQGLAVEQKDGTFKIQHGMKLKVPVLDEDEIEEILKGLENQS